VSLAAFDEALSTAAPRWGLSGIVAPLGMAKNVQGLGLRIVQRDEAVAESMTPAMVIGPPDSACAEPRSRRRLSWAELMRRVFSLDVLECPCVEGG
jgi:hypothetical protein